MSGASTCPICGEPAGEDFACTIAARNGIGRPTAGRCDALGSQWRIELVPDETRSFAEWLGAERGPGKTLLAVLDVQSAAVIASFRAALGAFAGEMRGSFTRGTFIGTDGTTIVFRDIREQGPLPAADAFWRCS